jgi:hypothetical protein
MSSRIFAASMFGLALGLSLLAPAPAAAYPQWQFSSGATRCNQCHFSPGGGGLITGYGRDAVGEELSTVEGSGAFLHGKVELPSALAIGGDVRAAFLAKDVQEPDGATRAVFPMQADLMVRLAVHDSVSIHASGGLRGRTRTSQDIVPDSNFQPIDASRFISREHYVMWRQGGQGAYVRAGRFYAPFGLRLAEHVVYTRRDLGFNMLEESYNLSGGYLTDAWEGHLTLFTPDFVREIGSEEGGVAAYAERRILNDRGALGLQAKYAVGRGLDRWIGGLVGKYYIERLMTLLLAEANLVHLQPDLVGSSNQFVGTGGFAVLPVRGLIITLLGERNQVDLKVRGSVWNAATGIVSWFPYPHVELAVMGRVQFPGGGEAAPAVLTQFHYFL